MANKATPEELAMHQKAQEEDTTLGKIADALENGDGQAKDNTADGDIKSDTVPPKRKRGRPSNAEKALQDQLEKETPGAAATSTPSGNKPGRKPSSKKAPDAGALGKQLVGIHALAAMFLQIPEVQITEDEGAMLGSAVVAVCEEYNLSVTGKTGAAIQLLSAAAMIYGPRVFIIKGRIAKQQAERAENPQGGNVHVFNPNPGSN